MNGDKKRICFVSIDVEHDVATQNAKIFRGVDGMGQILEILKKFNIPATLFVIGDILERYPEKVKEWARNYEIASHSYAHIYFNELSDYEKEEDTKKFIEIYKNVLGSRPKGFRAPSHVIDNKTFEILEKYGFAYDSSVVPHYPPIKKYRGYGGPAPRSPYKINSLLELPVAGQFMGVPLAGAWIRKLPIGIYRALFMFHKPEFITLSMHSWDVLDGKFPRKMIQILEILKKSGYVFTCGRQIAMEGVAS